MKIIRDKKWYLAAAVVAFLLLRVILTWLTLDFESGDYSAFLGDWYKEIDELGGLAALREQVGNYGILYQFMIGLMTYLPISAIAGYKLLSVAFDIVMAVVSGLIVLYMMKDEDDDRRYAAATLAYILALFLPTVIMDSAIWAQCDSIYTAFSLLALLCLCKRQHAAAFILLGVAFSFKLQAVFVLPVFLFIAFMRGKLRYLALSVVAWYATCIPGFLAGRSLLSPLSIYKEQTATYPVMDLNFPSIWVILQPDYRDLGDVAVMFTVAVLAVYMAYILYRYYGHQEDMTTQTIMEIACLFVWTCVEFLPSMHERYSYVAEILLVILICVDRRYIACLVLEEIEILIRYRSFLFDGRDTSHADSFIYLLAYIMFTILVFMRAQGWQDIRIRLSAGGDKVVKPQPLEGRKRFLGIAVIMAAFLVLRLVLALMAQSFETADLTVYLEPWYNEIKELGGFAALREQIGNYGILYQFLICIMTYLPMSPISCYKLLSLAFDIVQALSCAWIVLYVNEKATGEKRYEQAAFAYIAALFLPTVYMNSAVWSQCDSIFTSFAILALLFLCKGRDAIAFVLLGIAISFKLQAVFVVPVFLLFAFMRGRLHYIALSFVSWYATCIPGFLAGRSLFSPFEIYKGQTDISDTMYLNFPSFWILLDPEYEDLGKMAIFYTVSILAAFMLYVIYVYHDRMEGLTPVRMVEIACLLSWTCVEFLPAMHERYSYVVEILLLVLTFMRVKYLPCLVLEIVVMLPRYGGYLFYNGDPGDVDSICYLLVYMLFVILFFMNDQRAAADEYVAEAPEVVRQ